MFTPDVDMISPDAHVADSKNYEAVCAAYARADNPFFNRKRGQPEMLMPGTCSAQ